MAYSIVAMEGLDIYPDGTLAKNIPWTPLVGASQGQVASGAGAFVGAKGLTFNTGSAWINALQYNFSNGGIFPGTTSSDPKAKSVFGFNTWIRIDSAITTIAATALITGSANNASGTTPCFLGIQNNTTDGLNLLLPSTFVGAISSSPKMLAIETNQYYWVSARFAIAPGSIIATYYVNGVPIYENVTVTYTSALFSSAAMNTINFYGNAAACVYTLDDFVIQASNGSLIDWPAGEVGGVPNAPTLDNIPNISPRRIYVAVPEANGSLNEWSPSVPGTPNWEAAASSTEFVEAMDSEQTDLYKFGLPVGATINDTLAVCTRFSTNKYQNVTPAVRENAVATIEVGTGVVTKGSSRVLAVHEATPNGDPWTPASITGAEFGQQSL